MTRPTPAPRHSVTRPSIPGLDADAGDARVPTQERGTRRVEAILDAAAELVTELGVEGVTVQALADRAATSKGSLYHFFPDVPAVLRALGERHLGEIEAIVQQIEQDEQIHWPDLAAEDVVALMLAPLDYLERNCDLLALVRAPNILPRPSRSMQPMISFVEFILEARFPVMPEARRAARAATIVAVIDGVVGTATRGCSAGAPGMRRDLEELLVLYLAGID